ncbi:hypothetical protein BGX27_006156 [Mortierella sp. AM989]|nr:hypothetical protein BGX27_006156 [Mortierella sp. AM989]
MSVEEMRSHVQSIRAEDFKPTFYTKKGYVLRGSIRTDGFRLQVLAFKLNELHSVKYRRLPADKLPCRLTSTIGGTDYFLTEIRNVVSTKQDVARLWSCDPKSIKILGIDLGQAFVVGASAILPPREQPSVEQKQDPDVGMESLLSDIEEADESSPKFFNLAVKQKAVYQPTLKHRRWLERRKGQAVEGVASIRQIEASLPARHGPEASISSYIQREQEVEAELDSFYGNVVLKKHKWNARKARAEEYRLIADRLLQLVGGSAGAKRDEDNKVVIGVGLGKFSSKIRLTSLHESFQSYFVQMVSMHDPLATSWLASMNFTLRRNARLVENSLAKLTSADFIVQSVKSTCTEMSWLDTISATSSKDTCSSKCDRSTSNPLVPTSERNGAQLFPFLRMAPKTDVAGKGAQDTTAIIASRASIVAYYALISRLVIWVLAVVSHTLIQDYDSALELVLPIDTPSQQFFKSIFGVFLRWDSFYFVHIAEKGYIFEQEHAFFPLVPALMRLISKTILAPFGAFLSYKQQLVLAGVLIANVSFIAASVQLYHLTNTLFKREKFAFLSAMLYVLTPSGIFMSAIYTESLFAALSFTGMRLAANKQYLLAAFVWSISCMARSNGTLYAGFFIYDLVVRMDLKASVWSKVKNLVKTGCLSLITWSGFLAVQTYGYSLYCSDKISSLESRPWCNATVPLIYSFVQSFYWNCGFLRYYEIKQIPNFLMAAPMITLCASGIIYYVMYDIPRAMSLGRSSTPVPPNVSTPPFMSSKTFPYIVLWMVLLFSAITTMHIQIITRAFSCLPPVYWFAAHQFEREALGAGWTRSVSTFFVMYGLVGIVLFANFFPPA